jgi:ribonuclease J
MQKTQTTQERVLTKQLGLKYQKNGVRIIPIGGFDEIGRNCLVIEYGDDMLVVDMGTDFADSETLGVDLIVPDIDYIIQNKEKVRGVLITHGHLDHINAVAYLFDKLKDFQFYGRELPGVLIKNGIADKVSQSATADFKYNNIKLGEKIKLGAFEVEFIHTNHSIPQSCAIAINTPEGMIFHSGDFKVDFSPVNEPFIDLGRIGEIGNNGVLAALVDSTGAKKAGHSFSESSVGEELFNVCQKSPGRIIIATFASEMGRFQQIIDVATKLGKKIVVDGRSMLNFLDIAKELELLKIPEGIIIESKFINKIPSNKMIVVCTGAQGQENAALGRMARGEHKFMKIVPGDTVVLSSSVIPGNEIPIQSMMDNLFKLGANVITNDIVDVHATGHGHQNDIRTLLALLRPKYLIPEHGNRNFREANKQIATSMGFKHESIILADNGSVVQLHNGQAKLLPEKVKASRSFVDGLSVGTLRDAVSKERLVLASDGFLVVVLLINMETKKLVSNPDIITRGTIYMRDQLELVANLRAKTRKIFESHAVGVGQDWSDGLKKRIRDELGQLFEKETKKNPLIVPVIKELRV